MSAVFLHKILISLLYGMGLLKRFVKIWVATLIRKCCIIWTRVCWRNSPRSETCVTRKAATCINQDKQTKWSDTGHCRHSDLSSICMNRSNKLQKISATLSTLLSGKTRVCFPTRSIAALVFLVYVPLISANTDVPVTGMALEQLCTNSSFTPFPDPPNTLSYDDQLFTACITNPDCALLFMQTPIPDPGKFEAMLQLYTPLSTDSLDVFRAIVCNDTASLQQTILNANIAQVLSRVRGDPPCPDNFEYSPTAFPTPPSSSVTIPSALGIGVCRCRADSTCSTCSCNDSFITVFCALIFLAQCAILVVAIYTHVTFLSTVRGMPHQTPAEFAIQYAKTAPSRL